MTRCKPANDDGDGTVKPGNADSPEYRYEDAKE